MLDDKRFEIRVADDAGVVAKAGLVRPVPDGTGAEIAGGAVAGGHADRARPHHEFLPYGIYSTTVVGLHFLVLGIRRNQQRLQI